MGRGNLAQTLFNMAVPPSLRRGDIEVLIAQQQLNVAVVEQLHAARLRFTRRFTIGRWNRFGTNNDKNWRKMSLLKKIVLKPDWPIRAHSRAQLSKPTNWFRKLKARIAPIGKRN